MPNSPTHRMPGTPKARTPVVAVPLQASPHSPAAGIRAGRYRIVRRLGGGGLGEVFVADDAEFGREVAVKEIRPDFAHDGDFRERFLREAEITGRLEHPGVVPVYGQGLRPDGAPFYAMRLIRGQTLQAAVDAFHAGGGEYDSVAFRQLVQRFVSACQTVAYAHSRGVIHRDLKPDNIMLGPFGEVLVIDWGLARHFDRPGEPEALRPTPGGASRTQIGETQGTPSYMSPEQANGAWDTIGPATDVYALGGVLYTILTGQPPVMGADTLHVIERVRAGDLLPAAVWKPAAPPGLAAVAHKALSLAPADRYATADGIVAECERWLADAPVAAWPEPLAARTQRWLRHHGRLALGLLVSLTIAAAAAGVAAALVAAANGREAAAREAAVRQRDRADANGRQTRAALDAMVSDDMLAWLVTQRELTADQTRFLEQVLGHYQGLTAETPDAPAGRLSLAAAYTRVGLLLAKLGRMADATTAYEAAYRLFRDAAADPAARLEAAQQAVNLAKLARRRGDGAEAERLARDALTLADPLPAADPVRQDAVAEANEVLGGVAFDRGDAAVAERAFLAALAIRQAATGRKSVGWRGGLVRTLNNLGMLRDQTGDRAGAEAAYGAALPVVEGLAADAPANTEWRSMLAALLGNLGQTLAARGALADAERAFRTAIPLAERLAADEPGLPTRRADLARIRATLGTIIEPRDPAGAEAGYRAAIALQEPLAAAPQASPARTVELAGSYCNLGNLVRRRDPAAAKGWHDRAVALLEPILRRQPDQVVVREFLRNNLTARAEDCTAMGDHAAAVGEYDRAADLADGEPRTLILVDRAVSRARLGDHAGAAADLDTFRLTACPPVCLYNAACAWSLCSKAAAGPVADRYAARAVVALRQAIQAGFGPVAAALSDPDLAPLLNRDDFTSLLWDVAETP